MPSPETEPRSSQQANTALALPVFQRYRAPVNTTIASTALALPLPPPTPVLARSRVGILRGESMELGHMPTSSPPLHHHRGARWPLYHRAHRLFADEVVCPTAEAVAPGPSMSA
uniref:Uncharacterized protein n=1 Tax=Oryza meridionalis TaxID=40149 RepID=A0A0E0D9D0_9ORYZ